jgi:hypothetical protein
MKTMSASDTAPAHRLERRPPRAPLHARRLGLLTSSPVDQTTTLLRYAESFTVASIIARILMVLATFITESKFLQEPSPQFWILVARALTDRARVCDVSDPTRRRAKIVTQSSSRRTRSAVCPGRDPSISPPDKLAQVPSLTNRADPQTVQLGAYAAASSCLARLLHSPQYPAHRHHRPIHPRGKTPVRPI